MSKLMKKIGLVSVLAALAAAPGAAQTPAAPQKTDAPTAAEMSRLESRSRAINDASARCLKGETFSLKTQFNISAATLIDNNDDMVRYLACTSAANRDSCDQLPESASSFQKSTCKQLRDFMATHWAIMKKNDSAACVRFLQEGFTKVSDPAGACRWYIPAVKSGEFRSLCEQAVQKGFMTPSQREGCLNDNTFLAGDPALCAKVSAKSGKSTPEWCRSCAAIIAAMRSDCAASPFCKALQTRQAEACAPLLAASSKRLCAEVAKRKLTQDKIDASRSKQIETEKVLSRAPQKPIAGQDKDGALLRAQAAKDIAEAKQAAAKKAAAEAALFKAVADKRRAEREAARKKTSPPPQHKKGVRMQDIPPEVKKQMEAVEGKKTAPAKQPANPPDAPGQPSGK